MILTLIDFLNRHLATVRTLAVIAIATMLVWTVVGVDKHHAHTWAEMHVPGFWSLFALISCVVLIFFAQWLGKSGIAKKEDYYDDEC